MTKLSNTDEWQTLQDIYIAIERNDIVRMITEFKKNLNSIHDLSGLTKEIEETDKLCTKLCLWNALLGR